MIEYVISFFVLIGILIMAYVSTRYLGSKLSFSQQSTYMRVVDRLMIDKDTRLQVVKINSTYYLLSTGGMKVVSLGVLEDFVEVEPTLSNQVSFASIISKMMKEKKHDELD